MHASFYLRERMKYSIKARDSYSLVFDRVAKVNAQKARGLDANSQEIQPITSIPASDLSLDESGQRLQNSLVPMASSSQSTGNQLQILPKKAPTIPKPKWHAPWKLYRVISGHLGWVRCMYTEVHKNSTFTSRHF